MKSFSRYIGEDTNKDLVNARSSYQDELEAIDKYTTQIAECQDKDLKKILEHNLGEEKDHAAALKKWIEGNK